MLIRGHRPIFCPIYPTFNIRLCDQPSCLMFFKICQSSAGDKDVHKPSKKKKAMTMQLNPFQSHGSKKKDSSKTVERPSKKNPASLTSPTQSPQAATTTTTTTKKASKKPAIHSGRINARRDFLKVTSQGLGTEETYSNPETIPSLEAAYKSFKHVYSRFSETAAVDRLREREYSHLGEGEHVCMDYCGFGLFSHWQQVFQRANSTFNLAYISANLPTHALYGAAEEGTVEAYIRRRIMRYMNISETEYSMVFTASRGTAYKLLAESYPFHTNKGLLTVYDYESDAVSWMVASAKEKGAKVMNASFKWPNLRIAASDLKYKLQDKKKKKDQSAKGLFVFPVQSRVTGAKYSYQWMSQAQSNKWHVLLDASALAPKDMDSLALSLFRPDFIVTSFYKVFGADPTGFGCLFIKNSAIQSLQSSSRARGVGMVRIIALNPSLPLRPEGQIEQERLPDIFERDTEEYVDATDFVDPVSSFSGPVAQYYLDDYKEKNSMESGSSRNNHSNLGYDNHYGSSEIEEEWEVLDLPVVGGTVTNTDNFNFNRQQQSSQRGEDLIRGFEVNDTRPGPSEIEIEDSGPIFPLTRRGGYLEKQEAAVFPVEVDDHSPKLERDQFSKGSEAAEDEYEIEHNPDHFLSRIQEEDADELGEDGSPCQNSVSSAQVPDRGDNGSVAVGSPLFHSPPESTDGLGSLSDRDLPPQEETVFHKRNVGKEIEVRTEADKLESNIMFKDDRNHALREGRDLDSYFSRGKSLSIAQEDYEEEEPDLDPSGSNLRRYWSPGEGSSQWADQYAMSAQGSPAVYDDDGKGRSYGDLLNEEGPVICNGLDHADSLGLNQTNLRLRFLINWLINSLLKLRHPAQLDRQGTNLVHIYGPEVHFDRGASLAFNVFDWNGVPVRTDIVQRLADRSNISLGLGTLSNIIYPEGSDDLPGLWPTEKKGVQDGSNNNGKSDPPRNSNASRHERPSEIHIVTAALGFVSSFEDVYRLWSFIAKFLDADFVSRETRFYHSLNQETVVL